MRITILIASILISIISRGQVIKGEIKSSSNDTIPFAQIELISVANNETENATYADENGVFTLNFTESEQFYFLKISSLGFQTHSTDSFQKAPHLATITLKPNDNALDAIVIDVTKPVIEQTGRGLNINIGASPLLENSNAKDILSKIPGLTMDQNGNLSLNGQSNVQVFVNGKPNLLSLEQLIQQLEAKQEWKFDTADYSTKEIDSTELKKFVGDFKLPMNKVVSTFIYKNRLYALAPWSEDYPLYYLGNNEFACEIGTVTFKFKEGKLKKMAIPHSIFKINGRLLNPSETKGVKNNELLGAYYCKDADATFEIKIEDCKLVLHHKKYGSIPLTQFKTLSFHLNNLWINKLWFTKEKGHITSFKIPLSEYEKLTFLKQ